MSELRKLKILYVDDEQDLCDIFSETFSSDQLEVTTYVDAKEAIQATAQSRFDMAFIDYRLPGTNGDEVAQQLSMKGPVYLITGDLFVTTKYAFMKVLSKPYNFGEIQEILTDQLKSPE